MALVLSKIDDFDPATVCVVEKLCRRQLQDRFDLREFDVMSVSATRYLNPKLRRLSGMDDILATVERWKAETATLRRRELSRLTDGVLKELREKRNGVLHELAAARHNWQEFSDGFGPRPRCSSSS